MALIKKLTSDIQTQENDMHKALKAWYLTPGIQHDLRHKEKWGRADGVGSSGAATGGGSQDKTS